MELKIGAVIIAKRKEKSWTQEQLAHAVGVSTPAVSKWETGATYPDITLLSPIARALDTTVDELLSYQNELSDDEVSGLVKKAARRYETDGFTTGWNNCQNLLREYPNSIPLKFYLGNLFQSFMLMNPGMEKEVILSYYRQSAGIYEEVLASGQPKFCYHATVILIGYYTMLGELDRAEELLDRLPKTKIDPDTLYPSIYVLRGKNEEALRLIQENIRRYVPQVGQSLSLLCAFACEQKDLDTAYALAKINLEMAGLFTIGKEIAYSDIIKVLAAQGNTQAALSHLEAYVQYILGLRYDYAENPVFNRLPEEPKDTSYVKKVLAQSILIDKDYESLQDEPRYLRVIAKLREIVEAEAGTLSDHLKFTLT